jgi:hypothetical protein
MKSYKLEILRILVIIILCLSGSSCKKSENNTSRYALGVSSSNVNNEWHYKFHYLHGKVNGNFTAKSDNSRLIYSSKIEEGIVTFELYNATDSLLTTFPANNATDTIGNFVKGEKYWVKAIAEKAKGRFDIEMKE